MHSEKSAIFALFEKLPYQPRLARNPFQVGNLHPTHASLRSTRSIMITTSNSSVEEERNAQSITRCSTAHHGDFRAVPRANRISELARNSVPGASSKTDEPLVSWPQRLWRYFARARIIKWMYLLRYSGIVRLVTCAASTSKKRSRELPCLVICPSLRRSPLDSSNGTSPR